MRYTVRINKDVCVSSGMCVATDGEAFVFDDDELAQPTDSASGLPRATLLSVAQACPGAAITVLAEDGTAVFVP